MNYKEKGRTAILVSRLDCFTKYLNFYLFHNYISFYLEHIIILNTTTFYNNLLHYIKYCYLLFHLFMLGCAVSVTTDELLIDAPCNNLIREDNCKIFQLNITLSQHTYNYVVHSVRYKII